MRIVREILFSVLLLRCSGAFAQAFDDEPYYPFAPYEEERMPELESDSLLFYRAVQQADDLWAEVSAFRFSAVSYRRRGEDYALSPVLLEGAEVSWRYLTALRRLQAETRYVAGARPQVGRLSVGAGATAVSLTEYDPVPGGALALRAATRNYRAGAEGSLAFELPRRWHLAVTIDGRFGRDALVDGVYTRQTTAALRVGRRTRGDGYWTAVFVVPFAERGLRSSSVEEAFMLRGSNYYNPAWGRQAGDVRNSRVRREGLPLGIAAYCGRIGGSTLLRASAAVEAGIRRQSSLAWYDASTPRPDNYHYLPSYFTGEAFEAVDAVWRAGDERYTQIDWAELYRRNRMQPDGEALYALEDRVERPLRMQTAIRIESEVDPQLTVACALRVDYDAPRRYKQLRDLLGADRLTDIDRFLLDDATYSNRLQNDLRHPDRTVGEGDRFGYDYRTVRCEVAADGVVRYRSDRWTAAFGASVGRCVVRRRGFYEKELFPGAGSYGGSSRLRFTPYALRASAGYAFSSRSYLEISASASAAVPDVEDLFLQPLYNNRTVDDPSLSRRYGAELGFVRTGGAFELRVTGYLAATRDEIRTTRFFDDLSYEYCDMTVRGIGRLDYGAEAAARLRLTWNWSLSAAVGAGSHTYATNPSVWLYTDAGNELRADGVTSYMSGLRPGGTASLAATAGVHYFGRSGWYFSADASLVAGRWVAPSFHYRTSRVANQASDSPETFALFMEQERLDDSFTADVSAGGMWRLGASRLSVTLSVRNLLDDRRTVYSAYESDRVRRLRSGAETFYRPFATSLLYAYGRSATLTVSYKF